MSAPHQRTAHAGLDLRILRATVFAAVCVVLGTGGHVLASHAAVPLRAVGAGFLGTALVAVCLTGRQRPSADGRERSSADGRGRSSAGVATLLAVGQTALHTLFGLGHIGSATAQGAPGAQGLLGIPGAPGPGSSDAVVLRAARLLCGASVATLTPDEARHVLAAAGLDGRGVPGGATAGTTSGTSMPWTELLPSLPMALGHVLAAVAAGWVLHRGDLALLRIVQLSAQGAQEIAEVTLVRSLRAALTLVRLLHGGLPAEPCALLRLVGGTFHEVVPPPAAALQHTVIRRGPPAAAALALAA